MRRRGMHSGRKARHATRRARASRFVMAVLALPKRIFGQARAHVRGFSRKVQAAFLAFVMVFSVIIALPSAQADDDDHIASSDCQVMDDNSLDSVHLDFKVSQRSGNGGSVDYSAVDPSHVDNIMPGSTISIGIRGKFKENRINKGNLCWQYQLPMNYDSVKGMQDMYDHAGNVTKAKLSIVHKAMNGEDVAFLQIDFNKDWVTSQDRNFQFNYPLSVDGSKLDIPAGVSADWSFAGAGSPVKISLSGYDITGNKNCWADSSVAVQTKGNHGMKCEVTLTAESDMTDFQFYDEWGSDLIVHDDLKFENTSNWNTLTVGNFTKKSSNMSFTYSNLPKGQYKISYTTEVRKGAANNGYNSTHAKNTAKWYAKGLDSWHESSFTPQRFDDSGNSGGSSGGGNNYTYVRKSGSYEKTSSGQYIATWQVHLNTGSDKFNLSRGFAVRDELQSNQSYNTAYGLKIYRGGNVSGEPAKTLSEDGFKALIKSRGEQISKDENGNGRNCNGTQCFLYSFDNDSTFGSEEVTLVYQTVLDVDKAGSFSNLARVDERGHERENNGASVTPDTGDAGAELITKTVDANKTKEVGKNSLGATVYSVPWTITVDPHAGGNTKQLTNLNLYEDWVNGNSDGNTQHMWYTGSTLNLKVEECSSETNGTCNWTDVTKLFRAKYKDGRTDLPDRTGNYDFPEGWYRNAGEYDGDALHDGVPAFKLEDNGYRNTLRDAHGNYTGVYTKKLRISYNTLFDGTPDQYVNYAKIDYDLAGTYKNDVVSARFDHTSGNFVGKTMDAEKQGASDYTDNATFQTVEGIAKEYRQRGLASTDEDALAQAKAKYPQGRWVAHWRVWGNGTKSWWIDGYSGFRNLSKVKTVSLHDTLPLGWSIAEDRPVYGRFVSDSLTEEDENDNKTEHWETFRLVADQSQCTGGSYTYTDGGKGEVTADPVCATYSVKSGSADFTVPNDGTLTSYRTDGTDEPDTANPAGQVEVQGNAIVVFSYDTYITPETLAENGYEIGKTSTYTNHANIAFDGRNLVDTAAAGNVTVSTSNVLSKAKRGGDSYGKGEAIYQVTIDNPDQYLLSSGDTIELVDSLSNTAQYSPLYQSSTSEDVTFIAATLDGNDYKVADAGQIKVKIKQDPTTLGQTMTISIPKTLTWTRYSGADVWDNGTPVHWANPQETGEVVNPTKLSLLYRVRAKGIAGQRVHISNKVKLAGSSTWVSTQSIEAEVKTNSGIVSADQATVLSKKNDDDELLAGATFKICAVDLTKSASTQDWANCNAVSTVTTGPGGTVTLDETTNGLRYGVAYAAIETKAPKGYQVNPAPQFFSLPQPSRGASGDSVAPQGCSDVTCSAQYTKIARWSSANSVYFSGATDGDLTVYDEPAEASATWQKADSGKLQISGDSVNVDDFLAGSVWRFTNADSGCSAATGGDAAKQATLPCVFTVKDNGGAIAAKGDTPAQIADQDSVSGRFKVTGFGNGVTYYVTEEQAPDGYAKRAATYVFTVDASGNASWSVKGEPVSSAADTTNYRRRHGLYVFSVSAGGSAVDAEYHVITDNPLLRTMPLSGRSGGVGLYLLLGLATGALSFGLMTSTGKERRPKASHSRV
ncbi:prealbumin-like fold domain-containing protein [Bifidobacterium moukalabense]|uniref:Cna protein B-type domain protein n=1 Tax=Bifidobacterium moukalabense DSM 27321 TaxID=1435051 RepID=W4N850_9BIFI|nr:prealbumin-like fold domain-containing protein [Bifidobacterium moukalabense]ETY70686.1 Cna protein B-type domain protein [Bifidobacterium moukalabense DSM 27321]